MGVRRARGSRSLGGVEFPARFRLVAEALSAGGLGVDAASSIMRSILPVLGHAALEHIEAAEVELVAAATGPGRTRRSRPVRTRFGFRLWCGRGCWTRTVRYQPRIG